MDGEITGILIGLSMAGVIFYIYQRFGNISLGDTISTGVVGEGLKSILVWFANVLPFTILIYGIASDIINQSAVKLALPSIVALVSMALFGIGGQMYGSYFGGLNLNSEDSYGSFWCTIPGLERLESPYMPTAFLATSTIAFYYLTWAWSTGIPSGRLGTFFGITFVLQLTSYLFGGCAQSYASIAGPGGLLNVILPIVIGIILGPITAGSAMAADKGHYNPFTPTMNGATGGSSGGGGGGGEGLHNTLQAPPKNDSGHSQPTQGGGDENTFVAELYKNGQLVTSTLAD